MADITIYTDLTVDVIAGAPPGDQSVLVAQLTADLAAMTADRDRIKGIAMNYGQALRDADAAKTDGQDLLDALA